jgi:Zn-dependent peptidase ImmA (M78 family)
LQLRQEWIRDYFIGESQPPLAFVNSIRPEATPMQVVARMRQILNFQEDWTLSCANASKAFFKLRLAMEEAGIFVVLNSIVGNNTSRPLNPREFRGFVLVDEYAPFVFVNSADVLAARMFTLAHELAHVFFGKSAVFDLKELMPSRDSIERACNESAAEFLVPESKLREAWPKTGSDSSKFSQLSDKFKVSRIVIARRALGLGMISKKNFSNFYAMCIASQKKTPKGGGQFYLSLPFRIGQRFGRAVVQALREGEIQYTEAYSLTGLNRKTFDTFASDIK